jgi:predicted DsbA family dithiol-disulfide isomerase
LAEPAVHELVKSEPDVQIVWRAFELRPEPVPTLDPKGDYLQRAWNTSVYPLAESLGVTIKLPPVQPRTLLAHAAAHWARSQGRFDDYHTEIFRAFFERGEDIGDIDVLVALALELGMDGEALRQALKTGEFEQIVREDERAAKRLGVTGVPAFIANRRATLSGVRPVEHLRQLVDQVRGAKRET